MKTGLLHPAAGSPDASLHATIVELADMAMASVADGQAEGASAASGEGRGPQLSAAEQLLHRARAFAEPLLHAQRFDTGEDALAHADGVSFILSGIGASPSLRAASYLVYASEYLNQPEEVITRAFGPDAASLVAHTRKLVQVQRNARDALGDEADGPLQA